MAKADGVELPLLLFFMESSRPTESGRITEVEAEVLPLGEVICKVYSKLNKAQVLLELNRAITAAKRKGVVLNGCKWSLEAEKTRATLVFSHPKSGITSVKIQFQVGLETLRYLTITHPEEEADPVQRRISRTFRAQRVLFAQIVQGFGKRQA